jgi:leucyl aminopeptidase (aminopeptidase T)
MKRINLLKLLKEVFGFRKKELLCILYDTPSKKNQDTFFWKKRRAMAQHWFDFFRRKELNVVIACYEATNANNADLPSKCIFEKKETSLVKLLSQSDIVIALTEFSATAPLHKYAEKYDLRVASMPGFNEKMIPALNLDYADVSKKVSKIYSLLAKAESIDYIFTVEKKEYRLNIDIRYRKPIKDDGFCRKKGTVINLPGGEAFIPPYEGEKGKSRTQGFLPIEINGKVTIYLVENNKVVGGLGSKSDKLMKKIKSDPAVGNIAEAAFGVLCIYGIKGCGRILLDEKLGPHIALGRCDHFGGKTGPDSFKSKNKVWHQDFVYTKDMQPHIDIKEVTLKFKSGSRKTIIKANKYIIF